MRDFNFRQEPEPNERLLVPSNLNDSSQLLYLAKISAQIELLREGGASLIKTVRQLIRIVGSIVYEVENSKNQDEDSVRNAQRILYQASCQVVNWIQSINPPCTSLELTYLSVLADRIAVDSSKNYLTELTQQDRQALSDKLNQLIFGATGINEASENIAALGSNHLRLATQGAGFGFKAAEILYFLNLDSSTERLEHELLTNLRGRTDSFFKLLQLVKSQPELAQTQLARDTLAVAVGAAMETMAYSLRYSRLDMYRACSAQILPLLPELTSSAINKWWSGALRALDQAERERNYINGIEILEQCDTAINSLSKRLDLYDYRLSVAAYGVMLLSVAIRDDQPKRVGRLYAKFKGYLDQHRSLYDPQVVITSEPYKNNVQRVLAEGIRGHLAAAAAFYKAGSTIRAERAKSEAIREFKRLRDICVEGDVGDNIRLAHDALSISRGLFLSDAGGTQLNPDRWLRVAWRRLQTALNAPNNAGDAYSLQLMHLRSRLAKIALMIGCRASFKVLSTDLKAACHELNHRIADQVANPVKVGAKVELQNLGQISVDLYSHWAALNHLAYGADKAVKPKKIWAYGSKEIRS